MSDVVSPRDCALAMALPLTQQRFMNDLRAPEHDYAAFVRSLHPVHGVEDSYYWDGVYAPFAKLMNETLDRVAAKGVTVICDARLADLRDLASRFRVVTFVSHWRFRALHAEDLIDVSAVIRLLETPPDALTAAFREAVLKRDGAAMQNGDGGRRLVDVLNDVLR